MSEPVSQDSVIPVVAGLIRNSQRQILLARRLPNRHQGGLWEFPGGKIMAGENNHTALSRELFEELGINIGRSTPLASVVHHYPEKTIQLSLRAVHDYHGKIQGLEGQELCWRDENTLHRLAMPAADRVFSSIARLPEYYVITAPRVSERGFKNSLAKALQPGKNLVQLRCPGMTGEQLRPLAEIAAAYCRDNGGQLLLNEKLELAETIEHAGVHLKSRQLMKLGVRPLPANRLVAASCHNEAEIDRACTLGIDFICLSPVLETASHAGSDTLGWERFEKLCRLSSLPIYALGGMSASSLVRARQAGALGVAGISGFWNCP